MSRLFELRCPPAMHAHVQSVLAGEYDTVYPKTDPVILDIGANVGSFAYWASQRWPDSFIHCYEPLPENFALLEANLTPLAGRVALNHCAVGVPGRRKLFLGKNNCGEASFFDIGEQTNEWVYVDTRAPALLPKADILKLDTEGAEVEILSGLPALDFDIALIEYHGEDNRRRIDSLLENHVLVGGQIRGLHRGVLKYAHRRLVRSP